MHACVCVCVRAHVLWGRKAICFAFLPSGNLDWESFNSKGESQKHSSMLALNTAELLKVLPITIYL